jgi:hypothetical protein
MHFSFIKWKDLLQPMTYIAGAIQGPTRVLFRCQVIEKSVGRHCLGDWQISALSKHLSGETTRTAA